MPLLMAILMTSLMAASDLGSCEISMPYGSIFCHAVHSFAETFFPGVVNTGKKKPVKPKMYCRCQ
jgi:hypothetical protein